MKNLLLIGDTDALISTINNDAHHGTVKAIYAQLETRNAQIYFPAAIVAETIMTCRRTLNNPLLAEAIVKKLTSDLIDTIPTDNEILKIAASYFDPHGTKHNTFFDAIVAASAKRYDADAIFGFDGWYTKLGFTLASEFLE